MFENFSPWKANTSVLVGIVVFVVGILIFGSEEGEVESSLVLWGSFGAALATNLLLHRGDDREREQEEQGRGPAKRRL
jgi:hypothetical protein